MLIVQQIWIHLRTINKSIAKPINTTMQLKCIATASKMTKDRNTVVTPLDTEKMMIKAPKEVRGAFYKETLPPLTQNCSMLPPAEGAGAKNSIAWPTMTLFS
jgi:hypothetical protein